MRFPEFEGEWETKKLGEIATFSKGKGISKSDIEENGIIECIRYGELYTHYREVINEIKSKTNVNPSTLVLSEKNDVIIPASGETTIDIATASCVLKSGIALGGDLNIIKTNNNGIFLSYYLNSKKKMEIANLAQGISVVHLYSSQLSSLSLAIPKLNEQNKISSFLALLDKRIQTQSKIIEQLETLIKSVSQKIFTQKIRFKELSDEWKLVSLGEVGEIITGKTPSTKDLDLWSGNIQFVTPTDIKENKYQHSTERTIKKTDKLKILPPKSIMFTCIASIGKMSLSLYPSVTNQQINSIIPHSYFSNEFIFYAVKNIAEIIKSTQSTSTMPIINKTEFSKFKISIPSLKEQNHIAFFLSKIDQKIETEKLVLQQLEKQKNYLLQQMFI
ncbi:MULTISPECIES: restriction endonuclease subunit S [Empedobacter]|uniref:restriction endonuclease subunit S n=2 Tax=Weeksellaceae TaxID=2762318 RepID=UPI00244B3FD2|nr:MULTISPECIES: restriction endonuclease subunit S [Empedobacter]MDH2207775.1 restriction endonuclease subunit S [Empedobacter sp. GD03644]MDM1042562.1 restriction endonuclease subunit S [Empedobacter brevis]MDM1136492.1 restriction endonuclease subunit S [Empedobacter sp. R750]